LRRKPEIIISGPQSVNFISILVSKFPLTRFKTIVTHHNFHNSDIKNSFLGSFNPIFIKALYNLSSGIVAVSKEIKNHLVADYGVKESKISVIYNPVVNQRMVLQSQEEVIEFPFNEKQPIIIAVGRLTLIKNYPLMLESFAYLQKKISTYLVIIGEGVEHENILKMVTRLKLQDSVFFYGAKSNPYKYIAKSNLLIHTSISESFGMVLAEALALGIPVISSKTDGAIEVTENGKYGTIFTDENPENIASVIYSTINSNYDKNQLIKRGFMYSSEKTANEYISLINEI